jgi:osmotically-inducible protein OsmY
MKISAIDAAGRVAGVRAIADCLTLKVPGCLRRTDTDLASEIADVLRQEACAATVKAHVQDGEVRLEGFVDWPFQRDCAETAIANARARLHGLKRVANDIIISQPSTLPSLGRSTYGFRPTAAASYLADVSPTAARAEH